MTWYAVDGDSGSLICAWQTGRGCIAQTVFRGASNQPPAAFALADSLSKLSERLWECYVRSAGHAPGWAESLVTFNTVLALIEQRSHPPMDHCDGGILDAAAQVTHLLNSAVEIHIRAAIAADVQEEIRSITRARAGDLSGRAAQALLLSPRHAAPRQLQGAEEVLDGQLLESADLLELVEPTAAAIAATRWLHAATLVAAEASGLNAREVLEHADTIEPTPVEVPITVIELLETGISPQSVVADLVGDALTAQSGAIARLEELERAIARTNQRAEPYRRSQPRIFNAIREQVRVCLLDPRMPAPDLRNALVGAIGGCWLVYRDHGGGPKQPPGVFSAEDTRGLRACFSDAVRDRRAQLPAL